MRTSLSLALSLAFIPPAYSQVLSVSGGGTGVSSISGLIKGNGTSPFTAAVPGTDYLTPNVTGPISATGAITGGTGNGGVAFAIPDGQSIRNTGNGSNVYFDFGIGGNNGGTLTFRTLSSSGGLIPPLLLAPNGSAFNLPLSVVAQPIRNAPAGINENSGGYYSASCGWAPTASGTYISSSANLNTGGISGVAAASGSTCGTGGTPNLNLGLSQLLLQTRAIDPQRGEVGIFVDFDDVAGATSTTGGQKTAIQVDARRRDDPAFPAGGGSLWALNLDSGDESNVGGFHANEELDYHNYSRACAPLSNNTSGCFHIQTWHSYLTAFPGLADIYVNTQGQSLTYGTATVTNGSTTVTMATIAAGGGCGTSGLNGSGVCAATQAATTAGFSSDTTVINLGGAYSNSSVGQGTDYRVASVQSQNQLTLLRPYAGASGTVQFMWSSHAMQYGYFVTDSSLQNGPLGTSGPNVTNTTIRDIDILLSDRATTAILIQGLHDQGINMSADTGIRYAMLLGVGQKVCYNGEDSCFNYGGGYMNYTIGGNVNWFIDSAGGQYANGVSSISTSNATSPTTGALRSYGGLGVANDSYLGGLLNVAGTITGANVSTTGIATIGTLKTGTFVNTTCGNTGYVTIQDSTGASRKVMICG